MLNDLKEIARIRDNAAFLGYEFLTWFFLLLENKESQESVHEITKGLIFKEEIKIFLGNKLNTCLFNHKEQKTSVNSPLLEESHEVFASIANGHLVENLSLVLSFGDYSASLQISAKDFSISQLKLKNDYENNDGLAMAEEPMNENDKLREETFLRMSALKDVERVIDAFLQKFLALRWDYSAQVKKMREQVQTRLHDYLGKDSLPSLAIKNGETQVSGPAQI